MKRLDLRLRDNEGSLIFDDWRAEGWVNNGNHLVDLWEVLIRVGCLGNDFCLLASKSSSRRRFQYRYKSTGS